MIGADAKEIVFTSGATESNNLSIKGVARFYKGKKNHIITTQTVRPSCDPMRLLHAIERTKRRLFAHNPQLPIS